MTCFNLKFKIQNLTFKIQLLTSPLPFGNPADSIRFTRKAQGEVSGVVFELSLEFCSL